MNSRWQRRARRLDKDEGLKSSESLVPRLSDDEWAALKLQATLLNCRRMAASEFVALARMCWAGQ